MAGIGTPEFLAELNTNDDKAKKYEASSSNEDESSIEALSWSDFEDDLNDDDFKLLQSINTQFSDSNDKVNLAGLGSSGNLSHDEKTSLEGSTATVTNEVSLEGLIPDLKLPTAMIRSTLSVGSDTNTVDSASNAPVLDDGPIWAKGSKLYKFEENRRFNQKLTFCVLLSVVLAIGLGLGNLAAYNECEAEYKDKMSPLHEATDKLSWGKDYIAGDIPMPKTIQPQVIPITQFDSIRIPIQSKERIPLARAEYSRTSSPMVDPKYALHAEELSRVLTMLDELSRKIDKFENTTKQLGGIVLLRDDMVQRDAPPRKGKFLSLLDDVMKNKGKKQKAVYEHVTQQESWRVKKEQILDDIAEAVLGAMEVTEEALHEFEIKLQNEKLINSNRDVGNKKTTKPENIAESSNPEQSERLHDFKNHNERYTREEYNDKLKPMIHNSEKPKFKSTKNTADTETKEPNRKPDLCKKKYDEKKKRQEQARDWESDRAKYRQENRMRQESFKFNRNKKIKNWQIERDNIREKLRK